jgi:hypothetical protein
MDLVGLRTANSKIFDIGAGKFQAEIYGAACHYKDNYDSKIELWKDIDLTIKDGKLTTAPYELTIDGLTIAVRCKQTGSTATLTLSKIGTNILGIAKPAYTFKGNKATFADIAPDTDLEVIASNECVRFTRVLKTDKASLDAELDVKQTGDGLRVYYAATDADGNQLKVTSVKDGDKVTERILATDLQFTDRVGAIKTAKYPIRIDPTVTIQPTGKDNFLSGYLKTTNYSTLTTVSVLSWAEGSYRPILEFTHSIPINASITSAVLSLSYSEIAYLAADPVGRTYWAYRLTRTDWVEGQSTWNIYKTGSSWTTVGGDYTTTDGASVVMPNATGLPKWVNWTVTAQVQTAVTAGTPIEFLLRDGTEGGVATGAAFFSKEYTTDTTLCPKLVVTYSEPYIHRSYYPHILAH